MPRLSPVFPVLLSWMLVTACAAGGGRPESHMEPPYDFTAGTVFDIVRADDPTSFVCLHPRGRATRQMWDKRVEREFYHKVYLYDAYFADGMKFEVHVNPEFETPEAATAEAFRYMRGFGRFLRYFVLVFAVLASIAATRRHLPGPARFLSIRAMPSNGSRATSSRKPCFMNRFMLRSTANT